MEVFAALQEGFMVRQTDRQTDRQADKQTGRQTDRQADRQTDTDPVAGTWRWCGSICGTAGKGPGGPWQPSPASPQRDWDPACPEEHN